MENQEEFKEIINKSARWAAGIGVPGSIFPPLDITAMAVVWIKMIISIARISGHKVNWFFATKLVYSICAGSILYIGGSKLINSVLHLIPGAGNVTAAGANAIFNYVYTNRLGNLLVLQFSDPKFSKSSLMSMAKTIAIGVFADLSSEEVALAHNYIDEDFVGVPEAEVEHSHIEGVKNEISFGGFSGVENIADNQFGPTCGFEALENLIQLDNPNISNSLSDLLINNEALDGGLSSSGALYPAHYQHLLQSFGILSHWDIFSHESIINAVNTDHGVLAIGHAYSLDPQLYPDPDPTKLHAFVITDTVMDDQGNVISYKGLDSNVGSSEVIWPASNIENALKNSGYRQSLLITDRSLAWAT